MSKFPFSLLKRKGRKFIYVRFKLRDNFAGQALAGLLASSQIGHIRTSQEVKEDCKEYAESSYFFADAMMKARETIF